jgi:hypothetical protein
MAFNYQRTETGGISAISESSPSVESKTTDFQVTDKDEGKTFLVSSNESEKTLDIKLTSKRFENGDSVTIQNVGEYPVKFSSSAQASLKLRGNGVYSRNRVQLVFYDGSWFSTTGVDNVPVLQRIIEPQNPDTSKRLLEYNFTSLFVQERKINIIEDGKSGEEGHITSYNPETDSVDFVTRTGSEGVLDATVDDSGTLAVSHAENNDIRTIDLSSGNSSSLINASVQPDFIAIQGGDIVYASSSDSVVYNSNGSLSLAGSNFRYLKNYNPQKNIVFFVTNSEYGYINSTPSVISSQTGNEYITSSIKLGLPVFEDTGNVFFRGGDNIITYTNRYKQTYSSSLLSNFFDEKFENDEEIVHIGWDGDGNVYSVTNNENFFKTDIINGSVFSAPFVNSKRFATNKDTSMGYFNGKILIPKKDKGSYIFQSSNNQFIGEIPSGESEIVRYEKFGNYMTIINEEGKILVFSI